MLDKGTSEWEGWGTALKPAHEPICMARKPISEKTVAENCLKWGIGGINIDESRVETEDKLQPSSSTKMKFGGNSMLESSTMNDPNWEQSSLGRFPANLILGADENGVHEEVRECFPDTKSHGGGNATFGGSFGNGKSVTDTTAMNRYAGDSGNASRFFKSILYYPKASKSERNKGCEGLEEVGGKANEVTVRGNTNPVCLSCNKSRYDRGDGVCECEQPNWKECINKPQSNNHPTVKPIALMEYLIKMVTPKGGTVLDPFMGSGSTGCAAVVNNFNFIGIDMTPEYIEIAKCRISEWTKKKNQVKQKTLFE